MGRASRTKWERRAARYRGLLALGKTDEAKTLAEKIGYRRAKTWGEWRVFFRGGLAGAIRVPRECWQREVARG